MRKPADHMKTAARMRLSLASKENASVGERQVSWLMDHQADRAFPSPPRQQWHHAAALPIHSGGTAPELHRSSLFAFRFSERPFPPVTSFAIII
jgi:hypothetical protein